MVSPFLLVGGGLAAYHLLSKKERRPAPKLGMYRKTQSVPSVRIGQIPADRNHHFHYGQDAHGPTVTKIEGLG